MIKKLQVLKLIDVFRVVAVFDAIVVAAIVATIVTIALYNANLNPQNTEQSSSAVTPSIQLIDPPSGKVGTHIVISGSGFTANNTIVISGKEILKEIEASKNGTKIEFDLLDFEVLCEPEINCPLKIVVSNGNGVSDSVTFKLVGQGFELPTNPDLLENFN